MSIYTSKNLQHNYRTLDLNFDYQMMEN